jgi:hypothetical protein
MTLNLPSKATLILSLVATALAVLNETTLQLGGVWSTGVLVATGVLSAMGISRLTGEQFRSLLDLTNAESSVVSAALTALALWAKDASNLSTTEHAIVAGVLVAAAGLGFGPDTGAKVKALRSRIPARTGI